jgi:hypothetical protein
MGPTTATKSRSLPVEFTFPQWRANRAIGEKRTVLLAWGRGVGKSHFIRAQWYMLVARWDGRLRQGARKRLLGVRIGVLMSTLTQFADVHWDSIEQELGPGGDWAFLRAKFDKVRKQIRFPGGSTIRPIPAAAANSRRGRGLRVDMISVDEADDVDAAVLDGIAVPWLSEPWSLKMMILAGTPTRGRHGLWWRTRRQGSLGRRLRRGEAPESVLSGEDIKAFSGLAPKGQLDRVVDAIRNTYTFHATYQDSPETVGEDAVAIAIATTPAATFKREWLADPDAGEGLVYPFDDKHHIQAAPPLETFREFHIGIDFGWADPAVLLLAGIKGHGNDATVWFLDESYESEIPNHIWDQRLVAMHNSVAPHGRVTLWPDPSRPERASDFRALGMVVGDTDNDILGGIGRVAELMFIRETEQGERWSRLYVSPKCRNLIAELGKYRRKKAADGTFDEMPEDKWNHAADSCRYLITGRFGRAQNYRSVVSGR